MPWSSRPAIALAFAARNRSNPAPGYYSGGAHGLRADSFDVASYALVSLAAVVRVVLPIVQPEATMTAIVASATLWSAAFAIFSLRYWPVLTRPRLDGAPG